MTDTSEIQGSDSDFLLARIVEEYGEQLRAGAGPELEEFVGRLPGREEELRDCLLTIDKLERTELSSGRKRATGVAVSQLGEYKIERELGRGGMGVVFLATDETLGRRVALKLLPVQATLDPRFLRRFRREARAAAQLTHPHIVPVYGVGEHASLHYYAMQYVEGHALDRVVQALRDWSADEPSAKEASSVGTMAAGLLRRELSSDSGDGAPRAAASAPGFEPSPVALTRGPVYHKNVAHIGVQVAEALAYAHSHGILHRDIKPSNLLMDAGGCMWVADFGLCTTAEGEQLTVTTDLVGTVRYMAPEQIEGRGDVRSDEYGLGITLYELLTLRPAFPGQDRAGLITRVTNDQPARPRKLDPSIPADLEAIVLKATAKLPEERYGSAEALALDLLAFLDGRPIAARPPSALRLFRLAIRRNKVLAGTIAAALLILAAFTWFYVAGLRAARDEQDRNLYQASVAAAAAASSNPQTARNYLERAPAHLRNWEWEQLDASLDSSLSTVAGIGSRLLDLDVSPDGRLLISAGERVLVRELAGPRREWAFEGPLMANVRISPDGKQAVAVGEDKLQLLSLEGGPTLGATRVSPPGSSLSVSYDLTGERIFVGTRMGRIYAYESTLEEEPFLFPGGHGGWVTELQATPDGRSLVSGSWDGTLQVHDLDSLESRLFGQHGSPVFCLDVSSDGTRFASGGLDGGVHLWDAATGKRIAAWDGHEGVVRKVKFSADGTQLVSSADDRTLRVWDLARLETINVLSGHDTGVVGLEYLPDGRIVSAGSGGILKRWHPEAAGGSVSLRGHICDLWSVAFDGSGGHLVSTGRDGTVRVWDAWTGRQQRVFVHSMPASAVFSPDGERVLAGYKDGSLRLWDLETGERLWEHLRAAGEPDGEVQVAFASSADRFYTVTHHRGVDIWERRGAGWERIESAALPEASTLALSASGRYLAAGCWDGTCAVFDTGSLELLWLSPEVEPGWVLTRFSPDESTLAVAGGSGAVTLLRRADGEPLRVFRVEPEGTPNSITIWGLDFNRDGTRLACATENLGVTLWDPARGELVARLRGRERGHTRAIFSPDGQRIATPSWKGLIRIWDTTPASERYERVLSSSPDPLALAHAELGTLAGLYAATLAFLRSEGLTEADKAQAYGLAHGLYKENSFDSRALGAAGEAKYRRGDRRTAREFFLAAASASELEGAASFDAYVFLAMIEADAGNVDAAAEALERASRLADENDAGHARLLAEARSRVGDLAPGPP